MEGNAARGAAEGPARAADEQVEPLAPVQLEPLIADSDRAGGGPSRSSAGASGCGPWRSGWSGGATWAGAR